jgi:hypothetical protein
MADSGYETSESDLRAAEIYQAARASGLSNSEANKIASQWQSEAAYAAPTKEVKDLSSYNAIQSDWKGDPNIFANDQGIQAVLTDKGYVAPESLNLLLKPDEKITKDTLVQAVNDDGLKLYLTDPNDPNSRTTNYTGIPAIGGTIGQVAYQPPRNNSVFGTIGSDLAAAARDPYFHNFLAAAAAITGGGLALNSAFGAGGLGAATGATALPVADVGLLGATELGAAGSGAGGYAGAGVGEFLAADAAASAAGQGAFDLAASLGMPLDQAVTSGLITGNGALTEAGAAALLGESASSAGGMSAADAVAASSGELGAEFGVQGAELTGTAPLSTTGLTTAAKAAGPVLSALAKTFGGTGAGNPLSSSAGSPAATSSGGGGGGGALPGNLQSTVLQGVAAPQYDPFANYDDLPQLQPIGAADGGGATQLAQMQQQVNQIDPRLYGVLKNRVAPTFYTYGKDTRNNPTQLMADKLGPKPSPSYPAQSSSLTRSPLYDTYGLKPPTMAENEAIPDSVPFRDGGDVHIPEFITGATGHYVKGRGDGQSDDIPAMLADGEYVFDAETVAQLGNGSSDAGAEVLDKMRETIRRHKRSAPIDEIPPKSKSPLEYLAETTKGKRT